MPGAQPRRGFEARMGSTARRGSFTPAGVPGVYRVPRRGRNVLVPNDPGTPAVGEPLWVQPEDVETTANVSVLLRTENGTPGTGATDAVFSDLAPTQAETNAFSGGDDIIWQTVIVQLNHDNLNADPVSPSPPPGMSVEYEDPQGVLLEASIEVRVQSAADVGEFGTVWVEVQEMLLADLLPGRLILPAGVDTGPSHTVAGSPVWNNGGVDGDYYIGPFTQTFPDPEQVVAWRIGEMNSLDETNLSSLDGDAYVTVQGQVTSAVGVSYTYRPPRYRFV
jgi:hypothetical protein